jgi:hypothetical protein
MNEIDIIRVDALPSRQKPVRNLKVFAEAAKAVPEVWVQLPYEDDGHCGMASNLKRYGVEARIRNGITYCRYEAKA